MLANSPEIVTSNIGKWLQWFGFTNIPIWVHSLVFEVFLWIVSIALLTFPFYERYFCLCKKNILNLPELFTTNNKTASFVDIAQSISKYYKIVPSRMHFLLLQGFWNGCFDNATPLNRLNILKNILYDAAVKDNFVWHYLNDTPPITSRYLSDNSTEYDIRPLLTVPSKNTTNWTVQNCKKAFKTLGTEPIYDDEIYPKYITSLIRPAFMNIKISQKDLNKFLFKEKIFLKSR